MRFSLLILVLCLMMVSCEKDSGTDTIDSMSFVELNGMDQFENKVSDGISLVFFHTTWCTLCKAQRPEIEALLTDGDLQHVFFGQVDFEKNAEVNSKYNVFHFPTILILKDGEEKHYLTGSTNKKEKLKELLMAL